MQGPIHEFFTNDHRRLDALLNTATRDPDTIDMVSYSEFRKGLLRHIKLEENILFRAAANARGGDPLPIVQRLRLDHGALTALMVPPPSSHIINALLFILEKHDLLEEQPGGLYDACDELTRNDIDELMGTIQSASDVPVHPFNESPHAIDATRRALARAGYHLEM